MEIVSFQEILKVTEGKLVQGNPVGETTGISTDSRTISKGELFIALKGEHFDGHDFVEKAFMRGAQGAVVSEEIFSAKRIAHSEKLKTHHAPRTTHNTKPIIAVKDTIKALGEIASSYRKKFDVMVIAVTGSNGKTTTKDMSAAILSRRFTTLKSEASYNNNIGVPLTLLRFSSDYTAAVLEMEMNILGELAKLARMAKPLVGIITNVGDTHLEFLGTKEGVAQEKSELAESLAADGTLVLNADDSLVMEMKKKSRVKRILTFGIKEEADVRANRIENLGLEGVRFSLNDHNTIRLLALGSYNVYNALAAAAGAMAIGLDYSVIAEGLDNFIPSPMRGQLINREDFKVINDAYNANPQSMRAALSALKGIELLRGEKIAVLGNMLELGMFSDQAHYELGCWIASIGLGILLTVGDRAHMIAQGARERGMPERNIFICDDNEEAHQILRDVIGTDDVVLIKGSRKMRMEEIVESLISK